MALNPDPSDYDLDKLLGGVDQVAEGDEIEDLCFRRPSALFMRSFDERMRKMSERLYLETVIDFAMWKL